MESLGLSQKDQSCVDWNWSVWSSRKAELVASDVQNLRMMLMEVDGTREVGCSRRMHSLVITAFGQVNCLTM